MTDIAGLGRIAAPVGPSAPRAGAGAGGGFKVSSRGEARVASAAPATELSGLLAMQEAGGAEVRDREARRRGHAMLKGLAQLQSALLGGSDDPEALLQLRQLAEHEADAADPGLLVALRATRLRAQVELARRGL